MLTDRQAIELVQRTNPVPDLDRLPEPRYDALELLNVVHEQRAMGTIAPRVKPATQRLAGRRWLRPATAFGVALALMLGAVGVATLVMGGEPGNVTDSPAPTTALEGPAVETTVVTSPPAPTTSAQPTTTQPPPRPATLLDGTWVGAELEFRAANVQATGLGLVATGDGSIWISHAGAAWDEVFRGPFEPFETPLPTDLEEGGPLGRISTSTGPIVEYDSAVYVFGHVATATESGPSRLVRYVWRSRDGANWEQIPLPPSSQMHSAISGAATVGSGMLAYVEGDRNAPILFLSDDGTNWVAIEHEDSDLAADDLANVVAHDGQFWALTTTYLGETGERHQVYTSATGEFWDPGHEFAPDAFPFNSAASSGDALYLSGISFGQVEASVQHPGLWRTHDGPSFDQIVLPPEAYASWGFATEVVATPHGVLVVAWLAPHDEQPSHIALLAGDNDVAFEVIDDPDALFLDAYPSDAASFGDRIVIVGEKAGTAYSWMWSPSS